MKPKPGDCYYNVWFGEQVTVTKVTKKYVYFKTNFFETRHTIHEFNIEHKHNIKLARKAFVKEEIKRLSDKVVYYNKCKEEDKKLLKEFKKELEKL